MANEIKTRSGLTPDETGLPYSITTSKVEEYLQRKVNTISSGIANTTGEAEKNVSIRIYTTEAGRNFLPFIIVLPLDVLADNPNKKKHTGEHPMFNPKDTDRTVHLRKEYYELFKAYIYNKEDQGAFFSDDWRRARGVARDTSQVLASTRLPKIVSLNNGRLQVVTLLLDPLKVFHDMLESTDDNRRDFRVDIEDWRKIDEGEYRYDVKRRLFKKGGKKYRDTVAEELNRKMRGRK